MSDNKKYYYIKLKSSYFDQDNVRVLESQKNGHTYSLIMIKLYLKAARYDGQLMMTPTIPYDPANVEILANVIGHDVAHVKEALRLAAKLDLITIVEGREIWMTEIQNMIGRSSTEADRIRDYRRKLDEKKPVGTGGVQMYDKCTPELEIEIEIKKDMAKTPCEWGELHQKIEESCLSQLHDSGQYAYGKERKHIKTIVDKVGGDCEKARGVLEAFGQLRREDKWFRKQPFLPSVINAGGIYPRIIEYMSTAEKYDPTGAEVTW